MNPQITKASELSVKLASKRITEEVEPEILSIFQRALKLGIQGVEFEFSGSGDSGDLQETALVRSYDEDGDPEYHFGSTIHKEVKLDNGTRMEAVANPAWTPEHEQFEKDLVDFFHNDLSDRIDWDWYNNEGGGGDIKVNFTTGHVEISGYYYAQHDADGVEFNLLGEEEE